jgi:transposase-like protein
MEKRRKSKYSDMDTSMYVCLNEQCSAYKLKGQGNIVFSHYDGKHKNIKYFRCKVCNRKFSENKGTIFYRRKIGKEKGILILHCISEGMGIRSAARVYGVNKNTVVSLVKDAGKHCEKVEKKRLRI